MVTNGVDAGGLEVRKYAVHPATVVSSNLRRSLVIFGGAFVYTLVAALAIQTIILPVLLPQLHAGHGLMVGHDSVTFQAMASEMATRIQAHGWGEWKLVQNPPGIVGITAAVYALTGLHEPYVVLPIYSALYALSTTCVYRIIRILSGSEGGARAAAAAFLLLPSATMIYADLHKDAWSSAGILLLITACVETEARRAKSFLTVLYSVVVSCVALALIWVVRPYLVKLTLGGILFGFATLVAANAIFGRNWRREVGRYIGYLAILSVMVVISVSSDAALMDSPIRAPTFIVKSSLPSRANANTSGYGNPGLASRENPSLLVSRNPLIQRTIGAVLSVREGVLGAAGGSVVDKDVRFPSFSDFLLYIPRALQIGLFAPFPSMWFEPGMTAGARLMRLVSGAEMCLTYGMMLGWIFFIPSISRDRIAACLFVIVACLAVIGVMSLAMPNIGTLYRMRYPLFMLIVGLGAAGWAILLAKIRARNPPQSRGAFDPKFNRRPNSRPRQSHL